MQLRHTPTVDARYWTAILCASLFGTNLGDLYAHDSGLGIGWGLLVLLALFALTYAIERRDRAGREAYYWTGIIIVRTGATNIADYLAFRLHVPQLLLAIVLAALVALLAGRRPPTAAAARLAGTQPREALHLGYWGAMLSAGVFGTVVGDVCSHRFGEGPSALVLTAALAVSLALLKGRAAAGALAYWSVVLLARTAGTCGGDWLAENHILHLGLTVSTCLTGAAFVAALVFWRTGERAPRVRA